MSRLSPEEHRELVRLSQRAQAGMLEILQVNSPPSSQMEALNAAKNFLTELERLILDEPRISEESVPDEAMRNMLASTLFKKGAALDLPEIDQSRLKTSSKAVHELLDGTVPPPEILAECLGFFREVVATRVTVVVPAAPRSIEGSRGA